MNDVVAPKETSAPAQPEESTKPTVPDAKPEESNEAREAAKEPTPPKSPKDVEMEDAKPDSEPQQEVEDKKASEAPVEASRKSEEKAPEPAPAATAAPEDTTEKSKDATPKADEKDTVSSEKTGQETAADKTTTSEGDLEPVGMSQLAIETAEGDTSTVQPSVEVSMTDAPATKTVREREDDAEEEPAAKRAKTEPKEDADVPAPVPADGGFFNFPKARFDEFEFWYDADNDAKPMTQHRVREIRKVVDRIKKTKAGGVFRDSVQKLWPGLWDKYSARIEKPMDLAELGRGLRDNKYKTLGEFKADLALILENSQQYNGPDHDITMSARTALITLWNDVKEVSEEEPTKTKQAPKPPRVRESRSAHVKPEGRASNEPAEAAPAAGSIGVALPAAKPAPAAGGADARRASTATEGDRPKRTVRAPKPKDIDYTAKPSRKKLKPELQFCDEVLQELMSPKHWGWNQWFIDAVDAEGLGIPDYYSIIKHPMDLGKISRMLGTGEIASVKDFEKNVKLMFDNCYQFNGPPEQGGVSIFAKQLQDLYTSQMKQKDSWLAKQAKANPPPASVSNASDDEEEDEEEDEAEDAPVPPDVAREIKDLEVRLREESEKLNGLFLADNPNQIMIDMQGNIVKMMQDALLKAKAKLQEHRQKNGGAKPAKKSKPAKAKAAASAGAARKATGGAAAAPKKPGNPKKKKNLTAADKDNIANAINDLEGAHLDRAIDIIKRDTGQMVRISHILLSVESATDRNNRRVRMVSLNWTLTSSALKLYSSYGSSAKRFCLALARTPMQQPRRHPKHTDRLRPSRQRKPQLPRARRTSQ